MIPKPEALALQHAQAKLATRTIGHVRSRRCHFCLGSITDFYRRLVCQTFVSTE